jgi:hypothetical protein
MGTIGTIFTISLILAILVLIVYLFIKKEDSEFIPHFHIKRHHANPILKPIHHNDWEGAGAFNPAVLIDDKGHVHMVYRALGNDGMSKIGYAKSKDGINFDERLPYPVYVMENPRNIENQEDLLNFICTNGNFGSESKQRLLEEKSLMNRAKKCYELMHDDFRKLELKNQIHRDGVLWCL